MALDFGTPRPFWIPPICITTFINCTKGGEKKGIENKLGKIEKKNVIFGFAFNLDTQV